MKAIDLRYALKKYGINPKSDHTLMVSNLYEIWQKQDQAIQELNLKNVVELESRVIWVTAKIESAGFKIDPWKMMEYQDEIQNSIGYTIERLSESIPALLSLDDDEKLKSYINRTYRLGLSGINKESQTCSKLPILRCNSPIDAISILIRRPVSRVSSTLTDRGFKCLMAGLVLFGI